MTEAGLARHCGLSTAPFRLPRQATRLGQRAFYLMLICEAALVFAALLWMLTLLLPAARTPLAAAEDRQQVVAAVYARINQQVPERMISVEPGVLARESSVRGFELNGARYYYQLSGERGFDPLSRGMVAANQVDVVYQTSHGPRELMVYTVPAP